MCTRSLAAGMDTQHQLNQNSSSTELDPNVSALWILYLYAAYIYNGSDDEDASAWKKMTKMRRRNLPQLFWGDGEFIGG